MTVSASVLAMVAAAVAAPTMAQEVEVIATGLDNPRSITIAPDGSIWVPEAGVPGDTCLFEVPGLGEYCIGVTGAITRIADGEQERVIEGLPSFGAGGDVAGISDVAFIDDATFYAIMNYGGDPADRADLPPFMAITGHLMTGSVEDGLVPVADVAAHETAENPDGSVVDSNPYAIVITDDGVAVADAGMNAVVLVDENGEISTLQVFPAVPTEIPPELAAALGQMPGGEGGPPEGDGPPPDEGAGPPEGPLVIPVESVPTSVALGPDGALYVGELRGGPFPPGTATVWRIADGEATPYATGFTNIIDLAFGPDGTLYVAEIVHDGLMNVFAGLGPPVGAVLSVPPGGGEPTIILNDERVMAPGGIAVDEMGSIYVSTGNFMPGAGQVIRISS